MADNQDPLTNQSTGTTFSSDPSASAPIAPAASSHEPFPWEVAPPADSPPAASPIPQTTETDLSMPVSQPPVSDVSPVTPPPVPDLDLPVPPPTPTLPETPPTGQPMLDLPMPQVSPDLQAAPSLPSAESPAPDPWQSAGAAAPVAATATPTTPWPAPISPEPTPQSTVPDLSSGLVPPPPPALNEQLSTPPIAQPSEWTAPTPSAPAIEQTTQPPAAPLPPAFPETMAPTSSQPIELPLGGDVVTPAVTPEVNAPAPDAQPVPVPTHQSLSGTIPPPPPMGVPEATTKRSGTMKWMLLIVGIVVVIGLVLFFVGRNYLANQSAQTANDAISEDASVPSTEFQDTTSTSQFNLPPDGSSGGLGSDTIDPGVGALPNQ